MRFGIKQAIRSLVSAPFLSFFLVLIFVGGFSCIFIATGFADEFLADLESHKYGDKGDYYAWVKPSERFETFADAKEFRADKIVIASGYYYNNPGSRGGVYIRGVESGFEEDFRCKLLDGRLFTPGDFEDGGRVCLIESGLARSAGIGVGDFFTAFGTDFEVVGVIKRNAWLEDAILPVHFTEETPFADSYLQNYEIIVKNPSADFSLHELLGALTDSRYSVSVSGTSDEIFKRMLAEASGKIAVIALISLVVFMYAFLNILGVLEFRRSAKNREIATRLALGARPRDIFAQTAIEYFIIMLAASLILFAAAPAVEIIVRDKISWSFGAVSLVGLPLAAAVFALFTAWIVVAPIRGSYKDGLMKLMAGN